MVFPSIRWHLPFCPDWQNPLIFHLPGFHNFPLKGPPTSECKSCDAAWSGSQIYIISIFTNFVVSCPARQQHKSDTEDPEHKRSGKPSSPAIKIDNDHTKCNIAGLNSYTLNSAAISDCNANSKLGICVINEQWDYQDVDPYSGIGFDYGNYVDFANPSKSNLAVTYASGYGNEVNGVTSGDIGEVNGVATADINEINGLQFGYKISFYYIG